LDAPFSVETSPLTRWYTGYILEFRGPYGYGNCGPIFQWCQFEMNEGTVSYVSRYADITLMGQGGGSNAQGFVSGDWLYWYEGAWLLNADHELIAGSGDMLSRYSLKSLGVSQDLLPRKLRTWTWSWETKALIPMQSTALGDHVYISAGALIYAMPLPPQPCDSRLVCPAGQTCGADKLCR
jgi:hypothetical protein